MKKLEIKQNKLHNNTGIASMPSLSPTQTRDQAAVSLQTYTSRASASANQIHPPLLLFN